MNNELAGLSDDVASMVEYLDAHSYPDSRTGEAWQSIRAELLRLVHEVEHQRDLASYEHEARKCAEAELADIKHELVQCDDIAIGDDLPRMVCDVQRDRERLRAELAALKRKIAEAMKVTVEAINPDRQVRLVTSHVVGIGEYVGQRVALLPVEEEERNES